MSVLQLSQTMVVVCYFLLTLKVFLYFNLYVLIHILLILFHWTAVFFNHNEGCSFLFYSLHIIYIKKKEKI